MPITSLAGRTASKQIVSVLDAGTVMQAIADIKTALEAQDWVVETSGDNITSYAMLCSPPVASVTPDLRICLMWDAVPSGVTLASPQAGTLAATTLAFGFAIDGSAIADAAALFDTATPTGATKWSGWNTITTDAAANFSVIDVWCSNEDVLIWFDNNENFYYAHAGMSLKADSPSAGVTSTDADGRVGFFGTSGAQALATPAWTGVIGGATNILFVQSSGVVCKYYNEGTDTWRSCGRRDQVYTEFNPYDLAGNYIAEDICLTDFTSYVLIGRLRYLYPSFGLFASQARDEATDDLIGYTWAHSRSTLSEGLIASAT